MKMPLIVRSGAGGGSSVARSGGVWRAEVCGRDLGCLQLRPGRADMKRPLPTLSGMAAGSDPSAERWNTRPNAKCPAVPPVPPPWRDPS